MHFKMSKNWRPFCSGLDVLTLYVTTADHDDVIKWNISALLSLCEGNPPVTGAFPSQRPVTRSFNVFFDLRLNKRLQTIEAPVIQEAIVK